MIYKTKVALGLSLALLLSGCGQSQADIACEAFKSGDRQATLKAFKKLYRENPESEIAYEAAKGLVWYEEKIQKTLTTTADYNERSSVLRAYEPLLKEAEITLIKFCL